MLTYRDVQVLAGRFANLLGAAGVAPEQRVLIALPDGPAYVAALFGILKLGARYTQASIRFDAGVFLGMTTIDPTVGLTVGFTYVFNAFTVP